MATNDFFGESPENYKQKTICCFVLDTSSSMGGNSINTLNDALQQFHKNISNDSDLSEHLEIALVTFDSWVETVREPSLISNFTMPELMASGSTVMVDGVREGIRLVEARKEWYKETGQAYLRPWIILITDGAPDMGQDVVGLINEIDAKTQKRNFVFLPIGVDGADMEVLNAIAGFQEQKGEWLRKPALPLDGLKFQDFFEWLRNSIAIIHNSTEGEDVSLPGVDTWTSFTI